MSHPLKICYFILLFIFIKDQRRKYKDFGITCICLLCASLFVTLTSCLTDKTSLTHIYKKCALQTKGEPKMLNKWANQNLRRIWSLWHKKVWILLAVFRIKWNPDKKITTNNDVSSCSGFRGGSHTGTGQTAEKTAEESNNLQHRPARRSWENIWENTLPRRFLERRTSQESGPQWG